MRDFNPANVSGGSMVSDRRGQQFEFRQRRGSFSIDEVIE